MTDPHRAWAFVPPQPLQTVQHGPLAGLTFSIKDLYGVPGWPLTGSTRAPVPDPGESVLVRRLLDLGAVAVGKTHLHEVALGITGMNGYGGTTHPTLPERVPGGSSSGAAVSSDSAIATDTLRRLRDRPSARSAVSSEVAASWPRPISARDASRRAHGVVEETPSRTTASQTAAIVG